MKKIFLLTAVAVMFTLLSCKKERVCTCTVDSGKTELKIKSTKKRAKELCVGSDYDIIEYKVNGVAQDVSDWNIDNCVLK
ncbi:MAG: hypothetical protein NZ529_07525 [Cytophagaceae bacterium]|nr:hypothetical protein [Cytophagaceae bacterium]MDW8456634.1 hypothetical protein [Cytophagaceae bacterium]